MWIEIMNGPNLHRIGTREPDIYGTMPMDACLSLLRQHYEGDLRLTYFQSNHEGALIDRLYELEEAGAHGIVLNAGAYTHTSLALADALRTIAIPTIEVHLSNIYAREQIRQTSLLSPACRGVISGFGMDSYRLGVESLMALLTSSALSTITNQSK